MGWRRTVAALAVLVLAANVVVLVAGSAQHAPGDTAAAAPVARTPDDDLDPLAGVSVRVSIPTLADSRSPLPVPEPAPANPRAPTPEIRHGMLEIPAIGLSQSLFEGVTLTAIDRGPSHWPGTPMPGEVGNVVIAGHRTTHSKPFYHLDELAPGDELIFTIDGERIVYVLDRLEIVSPDDLYILDQTHERTATLFGCHPRGSARQRIVGHFRMAPETMSVALPDIGGRARQLLAA